MAFPMTIITDVPEFLLWKHADGSITMYNVYKHSEEVAWFFETDGQWQYARRKTAKRGQKYSSFDAALESVMNNEYKFSATANYEKLVKSLTENPQTWQDSV